MKTGLIHIYTGEGKGKTTASVGLAVRALGHGLKVCYAHFNKRPELYGYNEIQSLQKLGATILGFTEGHWSFNPKVTRES
ncbi:MAG: cob(I)yrinic acid a,c-diamide adenosyltransferase, partial [Prolixibacteraceae bacterium]